MISSLLKINDKRAISPASPPSTADTSTLEHIPDHAPLFFSTCGTFLFSQQWHLFLRLSDVSSILSTNAPNDTITPTSPTPLYGDTLRQAWTVSNRGLSEQELWDMIPGDHPRMIHEDRLYAVGQHRFKIFRIRTYIVLGWSADGTNVWAEDESLLPAVTWFRRVICAVPQSMSTWHAILVWPEDWEEKLTVLMFPGNNAEHRNVVQSMLIFCPLTAVELQPSSELDQKGDNVDGWLRGHAFGCPYHLKGETKKEAAKDNIATGDFL